MEKQKVFVGSYNEEYDAVQEVEFIGEFKGKYSENSGGSRGNVEELYQLEDNTFLVHRESWSQWQGEGTSYFLTKITEDELAPDGRYWQLGKNSGFGRPLTLDEHFSKE